MTGQAVLLAALAAIVAFELRRRPRTWMAHPAPARGQALVEFALIATIMLPLALLATQVGLLLVYTYTQQNATVTLASVAATDGPGAAFEAVVDSEAARIRCGSPVAVVDTTVAGIVVVGLRCLWRAPLAADFAWPVSTTASAPVTPEVSPTPTTTPSEEVPAT